MPDRAHYAIITPYFKEEKWFLERCIRSVSAQTMPTDHFLVSDGFPQSWIDNEAVRHLKLDRNQADYGNTPRTVGAMLAVSEGYEGIGFLDADCWLEPTHVASCIEASLKNQNCDYVIAQRNACRPDGSVIDKWSEIPGLTFVDTNCYFFLPGSYHVIPHFGLMPREIAVLCDRVFYLALKAAGMKAEIVSKKTVNYHSLWPGMYQMAGEKPPPNARRVVDRGAVKDWLLSQRPRELEIVSRRCGFTFQLDDISQAAPGPREGSSPSPKVDGSVDSRFRQARELHREGRLEQAEPLYQLVLAADPDNPNALHWLGVLHAQRSDFGLATYLIARSLTVAPGNAIAHHNLGKALQNANRCEEALISYDRALTLMPMNWEAWSSRSAVLRELGRLQEAEESFDWALAMKSVPRMGEADCSPASDDAVELFKACCVCIGYCYDRGLPGDCEIFRSDLSKLVVRMADDELGRMERLCDLMRTTQDRWIKYNAAAFAWVNYGSQEARKVLEDLEKEKSRLGGATGPLATLALARGSEKSVLLGESLSARSKEQV